MTGALESAESKVYRLEVELELAMQMNSRMRAAGACTDGLCQIRHKNRRQVGVGDLIFGLITGLGSGWIFGYVIGRNAPEIWRTIKEIQAWATW